MEESIGIKGKRLMAGWDNKFIENLLGLKIQDLIYVRLGSSLKVVGKH
jgi:hypothetical protein